MEMEGEKGKKFVDTFGMYRIEKRDIL